MAKIAVLNDTHAGIRNSSNIFIDYQRQFYEKVFFPYLLENDITHIIHLGDYYENRKHINFKALHANRVMFLQKLRDYNITMDIIPGNHDVFYKNTNQLCSLKELLGHYMNEVNIIMEPTVMDYDGLKMAMIPWITKENEQDTIEFLRECDATVVGAHLELAGFEISPGYICPHGQVDPNIFDRFDLVLSGHFHSKSRKGNIMYLGAQMEFFWSDAHEPKFFHIFDTDTLDVDPIHNPISIHEKVLYDDKDEDDYLTRDLSFLNNKFVKVVVINKSDLFQFDQFIDRIQNMSIHDLKIAETFTEFTGEYVDDDDVNMQDTETIIATYIDGVETDLNKDKLKTQIHSLMVEAQTMEIA